MRNRFPELLVMAGLVIGCSRSAPMPAPAPAAIEPTAALTCQSPKRLCTGCNGGQFCALRCPECAPSAAAIPEELDATPVAAVVCKPPQRLCPTCTGGQICAVFCPECPAPLAPRPGDRGDTSTVAEITPVGESCGGRICSAGTHCCNASCGICTAKGVECTQQSCN